MRENKMHEAEILPSGELMVNKRKIGQVEGFRLAAVGEGVVALQEAKAEIAPLLAEDYDRRAERFAAAPNGDISVAQDGFVRWRGQLVAKLKTGKDILRPEFVLLADEDVSPAVLEKIAQRVQRFAALHFEIALKPLFDLAGAEALFEKPRFVALQLVQHLGIVPRCEIAAEVKELDQESRAALRRLGVRFGVYHIFIPALLKPAPAQALTLLWALKNDAQELPGYGDIVPYLMAGRTSFAVEENFGRPFYRLAGYRILGKRAVRIDMLERCADLIRQATSWQPGRAGMPRPDGAYDGKHFTISQAMLSILGTTPEDMGEILKQLGYIAQPVNEEDYNAFLREGGCDGENTVCAGVPQAEPVGDWLCKLGSVRSVNGWRDSAVKKAENEKKDEPVDAMAAIPLAEPIGPEFANGKGAGPHGAVILLWRYQRCIYKKPYKKDVKRPPYSGRSRGETGPQDKKAGEIEGRFGKHAAMWKQKMAASNKFAAAIGKAISGSPGGREWKMLHEQEENKKQNAYSGRPKRDFSKPRNFEDKKRNKPRNIEDSPFAALAALRDKMRK